MKHATTPWPFILQKPSTLWLSSTLSPQHTSLCACRCSLWQTIKIYFTGLSGCFYTFELPCSEQLWSIILVNLLCNSFQGFYFLGNNSVSLLIRNWYKKIFFPLIWCAYITFYSMELSCWAFWQREFINHLSSHLRYHSSCRVNRDKMVEQF